MARLSGKSGSISVGGSQLLHCNEWELTYEGEAVDVTGMDDNGVKTFIPGLTSWSGNASGFLDSTQTLPTPCASIVNISLVDSRDTGGNTYSGSVIITQVTYSTTVDGSVKWSVNFQGTGALTIT